MSRRPYIQRPVSGFRTESYWTKSHRTKSLRTISHTTKSHDMKSWQNPYGQFPTRQNLTIWKVDKIPRYEKWTNIFLFSFHNCFIIVRFSHFSYCGILYYGILSCGIFSIGILSCGSSVPNSQRPTTSALSVSVRCIKTKPSMLRDVSRTCSH